jgi:hypothetical protein
VIRGGVGNKGRVLEILRPDPGDDILAVVGAQ